MSDEDRDSQAPVAPGDVLAGKYRVDRVLGAGGMGVVVAATHLELREQVAVKFLLPSALENEEAAARFVREARAAVKIKSEHVARVIDVGRLEDGAPYMVMEFLEGSDLSDVVRANPLPIEDAVDYVVQACEAMAEAHAAGIVHRDLKPANLFRTTASDGSALVKVLDFGISKVSVLSVSEAALTRTSTAMGSPLYMSPEQMRSAKDVDERADIWSLGAILFELLSGQTPFTATSFPELCAVILSDPPRPLRQFRPEVPPALEAVVLKCLEKDAALRYQNVAELAEALAPFAPRGARANIDRVSRVLGRAGRASISDVEVDVSVTQTSNLGPAPEAARTASAWSETGPKPERSAAKPWALVIGGVAVAGVVGALLVRSMGAAAEAPAPTVSQAAESPVVASAPGTAPAPVAVNPEAGATPVVSAAPSAIATARPTEPTSAPAMAAPAKPTATSTAKAAAPVTQPEPPKPAETAKPEEPPKPAPAPKKNPLDMGLK